jgi:hypothetical protein
MDAQLGKRLESAARQRQLAGSSGEFLCTAAWVGGVRPLEAGLVGCVRAEAEAVGSAHRAYERTGVFHS